MFRVEVSIVTAEELPRRMADMREWLDHRHVEASFNCSSGAPPILCHFDFKDRAEAAAFAAAFDGELSEHPRGQVLSC